MQAGRVLSKASCLQASTKLPRAKDRAILDTTVSKSRQDRHRPRRHRRRIPMLITFDGPVSRAGSVNDGLEFAQGAGINRAAVREGSLPEVILGSRRVGK